MNIFFKLYRGRIPVILGLISLGLNSPSIGEETRHALIIGNSKYEHVRKLVNPRNDAMAVSSTLGKLGFEVTTSLDAGKGGMDEALATFAEGIQKGGVAMVYFAGHGVQIDGQNYLIPVDAKMADGSAVETESLAMNSVLEVLKKSGSALNLLVLDCCRDNPFSEEWNSVVTVNESAQPENSPASVAGDPKATPTRSMAAGLQQPKEMPQGMFIAFATSPGKVADDGRGFNSPYTSALVEEIGKPGIPFEMVFKAVGARVAQETGGDQEPWFNSKFYGNFFFVPDEITQGGDETIASPASVIAPIAPENAMPAPETPARGFFNLSEIFDGTPYDDYNSYSRQEILKKVQTRLKSDGFYQMAIDGDPGKGTHGAIVSWQEGQGLIPSGQIDAISLEKMKLNGLPEVSAPERTRVSPPSPKPSSHTKSNSSSTPARPSSSSGSGSMSFEEFQRKARAMRHN